MTMRRYRIVVKGEIGDLLASAFSDMTIEAGKGKTVLTTAEVDWSGLHRILDHLRDFAIEIDSFHEVGATSS